MTDHRINESPKSHTQSKQSEDEISGGTLSSQESSPNAINQECPDSTENLDNSKFQNENENSDPPKEESIQKHQNEQAEAETEAEESNALTDHRINESPNSYTLSKQSEDEISGGTLSSQESSPNAINQECTDSTENLDNSKFHNEKEENSDPSKEESIQKHQNDQAEAEAFIAHSEKENRDQSSEKLARLTARNRNADDLLKRIAEIIKEMNDEIIALTDENNGYRHKIMSLESSLNLKLKK